MGEFLRATLRCLVLLPLAVALSYVGGCASRPPPRPLSAEQINGAIAGNSFEEEDAESFFYFGRYGKIRGQISTTDGLNVDRGTWTVDTNGQICVIWTVSISGRNGCSQLVPLGKDKYQWGGRTFVLLPGNPRGL